MDTTLRYVQQFGRSKRDNLKPSLLSKYHVQQTIEVYPFRIMDFGCFASTTDGLSGLLHNSEMTSVLQQNLQEMIDKQVPIQVKINKYDRRTGEVAFSLSKQDAKDGAAPAVTEVAATTNAAATEPVETAAKVEASEPVVVTTEAPVAAPVTEPISASTSPDLEPFQFTISQPVHPEPEPKDGLTEFMDREMADIQKFLETVIKSPLSTAAQKRLRELLQQNSIFRFTYTMQTVVDDFEADVGLQLVTAIERVLNKTNN